LQLFFRLKKEISKLKFLDSHDWKAGFAFCAFGVKVGVLTNGLQMFENIKDFLPPSMVLLDAEAEVEHLIAIVWDENENRVVKFYRDDEENVCYSSQNDWNIQFDSLLRLTISEFSPNFVFLHSGAVAFDGKAIVIPGSSYSGKTTLTAALVRAGAIYYSDEFAVFDERGLLHPYPKKLSIRGETEAILTPVEEFGGVQGVDPLPVGLIILSEFKKSARFNFKPVSDGEGVLRMVEHAMSARTNPQMVFRVLPKVVKNAAVLKGKRGDADLAAEQILSFLAAEKRLAA
jgi:hypothetical protein